MQDTRTIKKKENGIKNKNIEISHDYFLAPSTPNLNINTNKSSKNFLGKKLSGDAELISWLSGVETNNTNIKEDEGFDENYSKIKKKLRNKLIKTAKKCEHYFIHRFPEEERILAQCSYCLKRNFNHNELVLFVNYDDFMHYLKYIFYLSDKVICYSINNFKLNKKGFDTLFSKFRKKEEKWNFDQEKIICKLCLFTLMNKPDFIQKIKNIFLHGENEKSYNINCGDIIIELNSDNNKNNTKSNFIVEKYEDNTININKNNDNKNIYNTNRKQINSNYYNPRYFSQNINYNNPNSFNLYNSNNININIQNNNKIINNIYPNFNDFNSFLDLYQKVILNNNEIKNLNPSQINSFWNELFIINHNKNIDLCIEVKKEILHLKNFMNNILINKDNYKDQGGNLNNIIERIIQNSKIRTLLLLNDIIYSIRVNNNFFGIFELNKSKENNEGKILIDLFQKNLYNSKLINLIIANYVNFVNLYTILLKGN